MFHKIIPCLLLWTILMITHSSGWDNPITTSTLSALESHKTHFYDVIASGFQNITAVGNIYSTISNYTKRGCPLRWIVRTRGNYVSYYMGIQNQIDETKDHVSANYTYLSDKLAQVGQIMDANLAAIDDILNTCSGFDKTAFMTDLQAKLENRMQGLSTLDMLYPSVADIVPYEIVYRLPNELIKALTRESVINYIDLGSAVQWVETMHYHIDRQTLFQALADYEFALTAFNYEILEGTRSAIVNILQSAFYKASKCEM